MTTVGVLISLAPRFSKCHFAMVSRHSSRTCMISIAWKRHERKRDLHLFVESPVKSAEFLNNTIQFAKGISINRVPTNKIYDFFWKKCVFLFDKEFSLNVLFSKASNITIIVKITRKIKSVVKTLCKALCMYTYNTVYYYNVFFFSFYQPLKNFLLLPLNFFFQLFFIL